MFVLGLFVFILGSVVGSFLNVVIDRGPQGRTALNGRSACDFCHTPLLWWELVPVLGFFLVGRRCRTCRQKLSWQYPFVELITGLTFIFIFLYLSSRHSLETSLLAPSFWAIYLYWATITSGLLVLVITDLKYGLLPDAVLKPLVLLALPGGWGRLGVSLLVGLAIAGFFSFLIWLTRGKGMGWGDVKLGFLLGLIGGWPSAVVGLVISFLTGAIAGFILILAGKKTLKETLPFGPFLIFGSMTGLVFGQEIFDWYWRML